MSYLVGLRDSRLDTAPLYYPRFELDFIPAVGMKLGINTQLDNIAASWVEVLDVHVHLPGANAELHQTLLVDVLVTGFAYDLPAVALEEGVV